ncbi:MAG: leucine-rich repeat domain-containing protein [Synergistaceae bacterium]|nr:leucine-rich repeat domain-containing protein [Synergistaceae bacterium]
MDIEIPASYFNSRRNTIDYGPGDTIIITGDELEHNCTGIGWEAFCDAVRKNGNPYHLVLSNGQKGTSTMGVTFGQAIMGGIISITAPELEYVGTLLFSGCNELTGLDLPRVTFIQGGAFAMCQKLEHVSLPEADFIYLDAFRKCHNLKTVDLPKARELSDNAFAGCENLEVLNIPMIETVSCSALSGCKKLQWRDALCVMKGKR